MEDGIAQERLRRLQSELWACIENFKPPDGSTWYPRERTRAAYFARPRHRFVGRFRVEAVSDVLDVDDDVIGAAPEMIYRDQVLIYVDQDDRPLPSTNSQPSSIVYLMDQLDVTAGLSVLEVGSGKGWLLAMLSSLVGDGGRVVGLECVPFLAEEGKKNLAEAGVQNAQVIVGSDVSMLADTTWDRIIFTAGAPVIPEYTLAMVSEAGVLVLPLQVPGGGEEIIIFRKHKSSMRSSRVLEGSFVPLRNSNGEIGQAAQLEGTRAWERLRSRSAGTRPWPQQANGVPFGYLTFFFRAFLARCCREFAIFKLPVELTRPNATLAFGMISFAGDSLVLCYAGEIRMYGTNEMPRALERWWAFWEGIGRPRSSDFCACLGADSKGEDDKLMWADPRSTTLPLRWSLVDKSRTIALEYLDLLPCNTDATATRS
jgi:protein-L-isoaspartate O-methyltransferase